MQWLVDLGVIEVNQLYVLDTMEIMTCFLDNRSFSDVHILYTIH